MVQQLTDIIDLDERGIRMLIERGNIDRDYYTYVSGKGRGGKVLKIDGMGLPEPYRTQYIEHLENEQIEKHREQSPLPDWAFEYAIARLDVVRLLKKELKRAAEEGRPATPVYDETADMYNSGHVLEGAFNIIGKTSGITLRRWRDAYLKASRKGGDIIEALAPNYNTNKGRRSVPQWYRDMLLEILLHPNCILVARAIKIVNMKLRKNGKEIPCSNRTAQRWAKDYKKKNKDRWVLMREGRKALNDKVMPYLERDWNLLKVGEVLIADGHELNFDVKHPITGKAHRPTLICFYDGRSRFPVGVSIMPTENTDNISEALADGIHTLGKFPDSVILDNGRAFGARHFTATDFDDAGIAGIYERYGILMHTTLAYHGQSKPIEPFFNQLNERFSKLLPTYRGSSIETKVARLKRNEKEHVKAYQEQVGDWLPEISEVVAAIKHWAWNQYGQESHSGLKKGETPASVMEAGQGPGVPIHRLMDLMLRAKQVRPRRARFRLEGIVYENWDALTGWEEPVVVRYSRNIPDKVFVFDHSVNPPRFMCQAHAVQAVHPLEKLTGDDGEFDPTIRYRLDQRKKLMKRAQKASDELGKLDEDMVGLPIGRQLPDGLKELPDATPNERDRTIEIEPVQVDEDDTPQLFDHPYQRFEHIAGLDPKEITGQDRQFLAEFIETDTYQDLYAEKHAVWVEKILNDNQNEEGI